MSDAGRCVVVPVVTHRNPSLVSYPIWLVSRLVVKPLLRLWPLNGPGLRALRHVDELVALGPRPKGVVAEKMSLASRPVELVVPAGPSNRSADAAILYLHGGAFVICGLATHRVVVSRLARRVNLPVFTLAYRQLPEAGVGASVADAVAAYRELAVDRGYRRVLVAGDSAGGFLAAKVVEAANNLGLPRPLALLGFSPVLDLDLADNPDRSSRSDAYLPKSKMARLAPKFDQGPVPLSGVRRINDLPSEIFPPTLIISAEDEMLEADIVDLVKRLDADGRDAVVHSFRWQVHAFPAFGGRHAETVEAVEVSAKFLRRVVADSDEGEQDREWSGQAG